MRPSKKRMSEERNWTSNAPFFTDIMDGADHLLIESKQVECRYVSDQELAANCGPFLSDWNKQIYFIFFFIFFFKKQLFCCRFIDSPACRVQSVFGVRTSHQRDAKGSANRSRFLCFQFFKCFDMSRFFSDFFTFGRNLIRDIRTRSAHHPHLHQPPNWHLVVDRRPKKVKFWWLSLHQGCHSGTSNQAA